MARERLPKENSRRGRALWAAVAVWLTLIALAGLPLAGRAASGDYFAVVAKERTCDSRKPANYVGDLVAGRVLDEEGRGLPGIRVHITAINGASPWSAEAVTDRDGSYSFDVTKGNFAVRVAAGDSEIASELLTWNLAEAGVCRWLVTFQKGSSLMSTPRPHARTSAPKPVVPVPVPPFGAVASPTPSPVVPTATPTPNTPAVKGGRWSEPVKLPRPQATGGDGGWFPNVAADDFGNVHVVWSGGLDDPPARQQVERVTRRGVQESRGGAAVLFYTRGDGQNWTPPTDVALIIPSTAVVRSALTSDRAGRVHLLYRGFDLTAGQTGLSDAIRYTSAQGLEAHRFGAWAPPRRVSDEGLTYLPDIAIDSRGVLHATWTADDGQCCMGLYYSRSADGGKTWSEAYLLEEQQAVYWFRPQLKVDQQDRLHVVWELTDPDTSWADNATWGMAYAISSDGGTTWTRTVPFPMSDPRLFPFAMPQQPRVGVDGNGQIILVWREASTMIYYQRSEDGVRWSGPEPLPGIAGAVGRPFDVYDMATDSAGHVHLAMVAYPTGSKMMSLLHGEWDGTRWLAPDVIANAPPYPEYPRLAIGNGNRLHVVWFNRDSGTGNPLGIWYSSTTLAAPRKEPAGKMETSDARAQPQSSVSAAAGAPAPSRTAVSLVAPATSVDLIPAASSWPSWAEPLRRRADFALVAGLTPALILLVAVAIARSAPGYWIALWRVGSRAHRKRGRDL